MNFVQAPFLITYTCVLAIVVLLNSLMLMSQFKLRHYNSSTNIYVAFLGCCNIIILIFMLPTCILDIVTEMSQEDTLHCLVVPYIQLFSICSNVFCMIAIVADLYRSVCCGIRHQMNRKRSAIKSLGAVSLSAVLYSCRIFVNLDRSNPGKESTTDRPEHRETSGYEHYPDSQDILSGTTAVVDNEGFTSGELSTWDPLSFTSMTYGTNGTNATEVMLGDDIVDEDRSCSIWVENDPNDSYSRLLDATFLFISPILVQIVLYALVSRKLWSSNVALGNAARTHHTRSVVRMCVTVLTSFGLCWGPWHFTDLIADAVNPSNDSQQINAFREVVTLLAFSNSWTMPLIYAMFNGRIRTQMLSILTCPCHHGASRGAYPRTNQVLAVDVLPHVSDHRSEEPSFVITPNRKSIRKDLGSCVLGGQCSSGSSSTPVDPPHPLRLPGIRSLRRLRPRSPHPQLPDFSNCELNGTGSPVSYPA